MNKQKNFFEWIIVLWAITFSFLQSQIILLKKSIKEVPYTASGIGDITDTFSSEAIGEVWGRKEYCDEFSLIKNVNSLEIDDSCMEWKKVYENDIKDEIDGYLKINGRWVDKKYFFRYSDYDPYEKIRKEISKLK